MKTRGRARVAPPRGRLASAPGEPVRPLEWTLLAAILTIHLALVLWGAWKNSVTFDENFHLPSGYEIVTRGRFDISTVNPPLVKALMALPTLMLGARPPSPAALATGLQDRVGESFMRANADHYHLVFFSARCVIALLSILLGLLIWRWSRRLYGAPGALLSVAAYAVLPESLAHAGVATIDLATGLAFLAVTYAFWKFARTGRWRDWGWLAAAVGLSFLVRFTAVLMVPALALLAAIGSATGRIHRRSRVGLGLLLLVPALLIALAIGYRGQVSMTPLRRLPVRSERLVAIKRLWPGLRIPLPDSYIAGWDRQMFESQSGKTPTYLLGRIHLESVWYYFPLAALFKWPLGFWGLLIGRKARWLIDRSWRRRWWHELPLLLPLPLYLGAAMFLVQLNAGVRYLFPLIPPLCVWVGGLAKERATARASSSRARRDAWPALAAILIVVLAVETGTTAPWYLSFFNRFAGGPGGGYRLVNDSNVDWGQGLIALRDEMRRRGIPRIHLTYHGTTDPAVYGIDYVPFLANGQPGPESDWLAVSSFYFVGLSQRMMTPRGRTPTVRFDFSELAGRPPVATPAGCMFLYRLR